MLSHRLSRAPAFIVALASAVLIALLTGCLSFDNLRGDGFKDSENWGKELRDQREANTPYGGVSTKAQQIERNLGVK